MKANKYINEIAKNIGPRGSTTKKELEAAEYISEKLIQLGYEPVKETFISAKSGWYPYALFAVLVLIAELLFLFRYPITAFFITLVSIVSVITELLFKQNLFRIILPKGKSQNVIVKIKPQQETLEKVILVAHMDTHRTPLAFSSPLWVKIFDVLVPIGLASAIIMMVIFGFSGLFPWQYWNLVTAPFCIIMVAILIITFHTDFTPYTEGANDNASGVAVCLDLAEKIKEIPLNYTETWIVFTGCEEVGCYGADSFAVNHKDGLKNAAWITIDSVGSPNADICYLTREKFLYEAKSDPGLLSIADAVRNENQEIGAKACSNFIGAYTESSIAVKHGFRTITLIALSKDGRFENWHQPSDILENVDMGMVEKCYNLAWNILRKIDEKKNS
jgi:hypothetical protein